jgi:hypothetical protein
MVRSVYLQIRIGWVAAAGPSKSSAYEGAERVVKDSRRSRRKSPSSPTQSLMAAAACMSIRSVKGPKMRTVRPFFSEFLFILRRLAEPGNKKRRKFDCWEKTHQRTSVHRLPRGLLLFRFTWRWKGDAAGGFSAATQNTVCPLASVGNCWTANLSCQFGNKGSRLIKYANDWLESPSFDAGLGR